MTASPPKKPASPARLSAGLPLARPLERSVTLSFPLSPPRAGAEPVTDRGMLGDYETRRLLNALVKEYMLITAEELGLANDGVR